MNWVSHIFFLYICIGGLPLEELLAKYRQSFSPESEEGSSTVMREGSCFNMQRAYL